MKKSCILIGGLGTMALAVALAAAIPASAQQYYGGNWGPGMMGPGMMVAAPG